MFLFKSEVQGLYGKKYSSGSGEGIFICQLDDGQYGKKYLSVNLGRSENFTGGLYGKEPKHGREEGQAE